MGRIGNNSRDIYALVFPLKTARHWLSSIMKSWIVLTLTCPLKPSPPDSSRPLFFTDVACTDRTHYMFTFKLHVHSPSSWSTRRLVALRERAPLFFFAPITLFSDYRASTCFLLAPQMSSDFNTAENTQAAVLDSILTDPDAVST
jgi:hypothetical protein